MSYPASSEPSTATPLHHPPPHVKILRKDMLDIFDTVASSQPSYTPVKLKVDMAIQELVRRHDLPLDEKLNIGFLNMKLNALVKRRREKRGKLPDTELEVPFVEIQPKEPVPSPPIPSEEPNETPKAKSVGRPRSSDFANCSKRTKTTHVNEQVHKLEEFAASNSITLSEALTLVNAACAKKGVNIQPNITRVPLIEATAQLYNLNLSVNQYQEMRLFHLDYGLHYPTRNQVVEFRSSLHPDILTCELKCSVELEPLAINTMLGIFELIDFNENSEPSDELLIYEMGAKFGADGSGSHAIRHQKINRDLAAIETPHIRPDQASSYLLATWCPLFLQKDDVVVWKNPLPNSILYSRPLALLRAHEDRDVMGGEFNETFKQLDSLDVVFTFRGRNIKIKCHTDLSGVDGAMVGILQGDTGSRCHYCAANRKQCNSLVHIIEGFPITKSYDECKKVWDEIQSGEMHYDDPARGGQCHEPLVGCSFFGVMHKELRSFDFIQHVYYRLVAGVYDWSNSDYAYNIAQVRSAKKEAIEHCRQTCGFLMDTPSNKGGNTNCGGLAKRFLDPTNREKICSIILKEADRNNFAELLHYFNLLLTVTQSTALKRVPNVMAVKALGTQLMQHIRTGFLDTNNKPWVPVTDSVHEVAAHSWEVMKMLAEQGSPLFLGDFTEQNQESWNKYVSQFKSGPAARARQTSIRDNTHDIFLRSLVMSHPSIASRKRQKHCTKCNKAGHTARSIKFHSEWVMDEEQTAIDALFLT